MKDYAVQEPRSRGNKYSILIGIPLLVSTISTLGATLPFTAPIISETLSNFYSGLTGGRRVVCSRYSDEKAFGRDVNATVFMNRHRKLIPKKIGTGRLVDILVDNNPDVKYRGIIPGRAYKTPVECNYQ